MRQELRMDMEPKPDKWHRITIQITRTQNRAIGMLVGMGRVRSKAEALRQGADRIIKELNRR